MRISHQYRRNKCHDPRHQVCHRLWSVQREAIHCPIERFRSEHNPSIFWRRSRSSLLIGLERLSEVEISQSSAIQRAGRAGRDGPGKCFRLYTEDSYKRLRPAPLPEIKRCDLTFAMLQQKSFGQNIETIDFMDPPERSSGEL